MKGGGQCVLWEIEDPQHRELSRHPRQAIVFVHHLRLFKNVLLRYNERCFPADWLEWSGVLRVPNREVPILTGVSVGLKTPPCESLIRDLQVVLLLHVSVVHSSASEDSSSQSPKICWSREFGRVLYIGKRALEPHLLHKVHAFRSSPEDLRMWDAELSFREAEKSLDVAPGSPEDDILQEIAREAAKENLRFDSRRHREVVKPPNCPVEGRAARGKQYRPKLRKKDINDLREFAKENPLHDALIVNVSGCGGEVWTAVYGVVKLSTLYQHGTNNRFERGDWIRCKIKVENSGTILAERIDLKLLEPPVDWGLHDDCSVEFFVSLDLRTCEEEPRGGGFFAKHSKLRKVFVRRDLFEQHSNVAQPVEVIAYADRDTVKECNAAVEVMEIVAKGDARKRFRKRTGKAKGVESPGCSSAVDCTTESRDVNQEEQEQPLAAVGLLRSSPLQSGYPRNVEPSPRRFMNAEGDVAKMLAALWQIPEVRECVGRENSFLGQCIAEWFCRSDPQFG